MDMTTMSVGSTFIKRRVEFATLLNMVDLGVAKGVERHVLISFLIEVEDMQGASLQNNIMIVFFHFLLVVQTHLYVWLPRLPMVPVGNL